MKCHVGDIRLLRAVGRRIGVQHALLRVGGRRPAGGARRPAFSVWLFRSLGRRPV